MKKVITLGMLLCTIVLVGCSNNSKNKDSSKESKIEKTSKKESSVEKNSSEIKSSETTEQDNSSAASTDLDKSKTAETQHDFDYDSIAKGDYSSVAGVWKNGVGATYVINSDGTGTAESGNSNTPFKIQTSDNRSLMTITNQTDEDKKLSRSGAWVHFIKIGENHWTIENVESDKTKPRITIEQGDLSSSEQILYREN